MLGLLGAGIELRFVPSLIAMPHVGRDIGHRGEGYVLKIFRCYYSFFCGEPLSVYRRHAV